MFLGPSVQIIFNLPAQYHLLSFLPYLPSWAGPPLTLPVSQVTPALNLMNSQGLTKNPERLSLIRWWGEERIPTRRSVSAEIAPTKRRRGGTNRRRRSDLTWHLRASVVRPIRGAARTRSVPSNPQLVRWGRHTATDSSSLQLSGALALLEKLQCFHTFKQRSSPAAPHRLHLSNGTICISVIKPFTSLKPHIQVVANVYQSICFGLK